jgi:hypothetical protein
MRRFAIYALVWTVFAADGLRGQLAEANGQPWWVQALPVILLTIAGYTLIAVLAVRARRRNQSPVDADTGPTAPSPGPEPHVP